MSHTLKFNIGNDELKIDLNSEKTQKMIFIYKKIEDGYTVKKLQNNRYEFFKNNLTKSEIINFTKDNMKLKEILK